MKKVSARKVIITSFLVDVVDVSLNLTIAILTGSVVMLAEMLQGLADLTATGFLLIGLKTSSRPADKKHPFGHGRELYFWTLLSALLMLVVTSTLSFNFGLQRFTHPKLIDNAYLTYIALFIAISTNGYALSLSVNRLLKGHPGTKILDRFFQSSRVETKTTFILDLMGTVSALLGLIALLLYGITGNAQFDGLGAMIIGASLAILSFFLVLSVKDYIIGRSASVSVQHRIIQAALKTPEVHDVLDLKTLHIGQSNLLVNLEVHLKNDLTTDEIEKLMDKIKAAIQKEVPAIQHIQIELETPSR